MGARESFPFSGFEPRESAFVHVRDPGQRANVLAVLFGCSEQCLDAPAKCLHVVRQQLEVDRQSLQAFVNCHFWLHLAFRLISV